MPSQTPFFLADNVFDRINLYPLGLLSQPVGGSVPGREPNYLADYRRERTLWQASTSIAGNQVMTDLGAGNSAPGIDACWIDRGHNLWGHNIQVASSADAFAGVVDSITRVAPALGTVGGDPTATWCATEEGALYTLFTPFSTQRYFRVYLGDVMQPQLTGIILGKRNQMLNYSSVLDEDEGERDERQENSLIKGYYGRERVYGARKLRVQLATIGITEYDNSIRGLRRLLFERDQPAFIVMNYGTKPERGWLYQYQGAGFSAPAERVYRRATFQMQELGPAIR